MDSYLKSRKKRSKRDYYNSSWKANISGLLADPILIALLHNSTALVPSSHIALIREYR